MSKPNQYTEADSAEYEAKLNDIANDPNLTATEKIDEIGKATNEELSELGLNTGSTDGVTTNAATADVVGDSDPSLTERIDDIYNKSLNYDTATTTTGTAPTADVVGDPATATYSSAPAAGIHTPDAGTSTAAAGTSTASAAQTAGGDATSAPDSELNAAVGVSGNVDYFSPRDVDGDGRVDLAHSRVDGVDTITHYGADGSITLVEQDIDHNGTYETAAAVRPDGTVRLAEDTDDDGKVDLATYFDPNTGQPVREDEIDGQGHITSSWIDTDGDGHLDAHLIDTNGDGRFDTVDLDTDGDGIANETLVDTDGDGRFDLSLIDKDNNGSQETYRTAATSGEGALGDISTYESLMDTDNSYHTQAHLDTYEPPVVHDVPGDLV
ncbi:hypothetical protein [Prescottella agglutinans]|uniref:Uncharacterized protein n=1 Tax=Prescottella agglutinans TaxID=1644129 RepID=A0ABT6MK41_9NOCA|nr:hypothetical protein [Prescottella agglutinans]MDH6284662.1 hypothetical protein [Prescottella agglutinans]